MVGHLWIFVSIRWFYLWNLRPNVLVCLVIIKRSYGVHGVSLRQNLELLILPGVRRDYLPPHSYTPHPNVFILQNLLIHSFALWKSVGGNGLGALNELSQKQLRVGASTVLQKTLSKEGKMWKLKIMNAGLIEKDVALLKEDHLKLYNSTQ